MKINNLINRILCLVLLSFKKAPFHLPISILSWLLFHKTPQFMELKTSAKHFTWARLSHFGGKGVYVCTLYMNDKDDTMFVIAFEKKCFRNSYQFFSTRKQASDSEEITPKSPEKLKGITRRQITKCFSKNYACITMCIESCGCNLISSKHPRRIKRVVWWHVSGIWWTQYCHVFHS